MDDDIVIVILIKDEYFEIDVNNGDLICSKINDE